MELVVGAQVNCRPHPASSSKLNELAKGVAAYLLLSEAQ